MIRRTIHYAGRVQGVGFRYTAANLAKDFAVAGTVENLPDGRVKLVVEGELREIKAFTDAIAQAMQRNIRNADTTDCEATGEFGTTGTADSFRIQH